MTTIGSRRAGWIAMVAVVALVAMTAIASAQALRLPADRALPGKGESPGKVTFSHDSHVDGKKPACITCHSAKFPILKENALPAGAITHTGMDAGRHCGACHDGKAAFGLDQCALCHRE